jgi:hypothetical protein
MEMMVPSAEPQQANGEVQDIRDALTRHRGRPKTREIPNATVRAAKPNKAVAMIISCELRLSHPLLNSDLTISNPFIRELCHVAGYNGNELF